MGAEEQSKIFTTYVVSFTQFGPVLSCGGVHFTTQSSSKVVLTFNSVGKTLKCDYSNENY